MVIRMMKRALFSIFFAALVLNTTARAEDVNGDGWVTYLLPIALSANDVIPGAHGTQWTGELWVHNASERSLSGLQPGNCLGGPCGIGLPAGSVGREGAIDSNHGDGGALFWIPATVAEDFHFSARFLEITRRAQPTGVEIPVIAEKDFLSSATTLLGIPVGKGIRVSLRVYDPRIQNGSAVRADLLSPDGELLDTTTLRPGDDPVVPDEPFFGPTYNYPGAAAIHDLTGAFPQLQAFDHFHIRLTPLTGNVYWAMASITDNETQHVLLITPQP
ncbi:MAG TPA: hypothetical protein VM557_14910 [Thermoanaerobaculia bacterium]|nr:hypothetical protein [Thermoanaerobaculia bacterium]